MKTLLPKLLFSTLMLILSTFVAQSACTASFVKSVNGLTVTFINTSTTTSGWPNMMMSHWDFGDGTFSYTKNPTKTYTTGGTKIVQLMINDSFGCTTTVVDTIELAATCNASFTYVVSGLNVTFTNTSVSSAGLSNVHYSWYFSNGLSSTLTNPSTTFAAPGMHVAQLSLYDSTTHCYSTFMDSILVFSPTNACAANFTTSVSGNTVTLNNTSTNTNGLSTGLSYYWYFSDGTSSTLKNPVKTFPSGGYKTISLTITDSLQGCFSSKFDSVSMATGCAASYTKSTSGLTVTFTNTSTNADGTANGLSYQWHFTHDATTYTTKNLVKTFASAGYKPVRLTISDSVQGCFNMIHDTIYVSSSLCAANFTKSVSGLTVSLTNTSLNTNGTTAGLSYYWYFSDGTSSTLANPVKTFATGGYKTINLTITDTISGCFSSTTDTVFLIAPSACSASFTFPLIAPLTVQVTSTSTNTNGTAAGLSYYWQFSDGTSATGAFYTKTFATPGIKWVQLTIADSLTGCFASHIDSFMLTGSSCAASFTKTISGLTVTLTNTSLNTNGTAAGLSYYWSFSDGTSSTLKDPVKTFSTGGLKTIILTITDTAQGCFASTMDTLLLTPPAPLCQASFSLATDTTTPFHFFILNTSTILPGTTFFWDFGDSTTSTSMTPTHTYAHFGSYFVCLTIFHPLCTTTFCDTIGMDSTGMLLKQGAFGFHTLDFTTINTHTATKEESAVPEYAIYPNPSNGAVFIDYTLPSETDLNIEVTDITGKVVLTKHISGISGKHTDRIDMGDLQPAVYFMTIRTPEMQKNYKLIRN